MRVLVQRVTNANVKVDNKIVGKINQGLLAFVGITDTDTKETADYFVNKLVNLRVFSDEKKAMNLSLKNVNGELLIVSQFTLYSDCTNGNRPSFTKASRPDHAIPLYEYFIDKCKEQIPIVEQGIFGADMKVELLNDGPVTILLEK